MSYKYFLGIAATIPLIPLMYLQGRQIRASVPDLPEASGTKGACVTDSQKTMKVIIIGESTMAGVGVETHEEGFAGNLGKGLSEYFNTNVHWKVYARSGATARSTVDTLIPTIEEENPDLIIVGLGGNDAFRLHSPMHWKRQIERLIGSMKDRFGPVPVVFANMPPIKDFPAFTPLIKKTVGRLVELLGDTLAETVINHDHVYYYARKITLDDWILRLGINANPDDFFSDGIHPSKLTYQTWAKDLSYFTFTKVNTKKIQPEKKYNRRLTF